VLVAMDCRVCVDIAPSFAHPRNLRSSPSSVAPVPRKLRIDLPDATHHIAALAVGTESLFCESADRRHLLAQMQRVANLYEWSCRAYCLMDTHFHLVVHTHKANLSIGMQHLCGTYAQWFNWKYDRRGHLFARRFASVHITRDSQLLETHRYVALNPVRAGLCNDPARWRWGSFRALCGLEPVPDLLDAAPVLDLFTSGARTAQEAFRNFVLSALEEDGPAVSRKAGV
jgi:putative transposase